MTSEKFSPKTYSNLISEASIKLINSPEYKKALKMLFSCYKRGGVVFVMGCGGSASTATHLAADLAKTTISGERKGFKAMALVDNIPLVSAYTNDKGWNSVFEGQLKPWITKKDILVGFSVHGGSNQGDQAGPWSQNLVAAMKLAQKRQAKIIGFSGFDGGALKQMSDVCITVPASSEVYGTPLVEAMHVVIFHGLIFELKEKLNSIKNA